MGIAHQPSGCPDAAGLALSGLLFQSVSPPWRKGSFFASPQTACDWDGTLRYLLAIMSSFPLQAGSDSGSTCIYGWGLSQSPHSLVRTLE